MYNAPEVEILKVAAIGLQSDGDCGSTGGEQIDGGGSW